ncbi:hypothetical protein ACVNSK_10570 [Corynebacterium propinquum]
MSDWLRYHNYCMREAHDIAAMNLAVAVTATLAITIEAFSNDGTFQKILVMALWWVIFVRFTHTSRIRPKQFQEEKE